jgi:hypothetical protein
MLAGMGCPLPSRSGVPAATRPILGDPMASAQGGSDCRRLRLPYLWSAQIELVWDWENHFVGAEPAGAGSPPRVVLRAADRPGS